MGLDTVSHIVSCKPLQSQYFPPRQVQHPERRGHAEIGIQRLKSRIVRNIFFHVSKGQLTLVPNAMKALSKKLILMIGLSNN